MVKNYSTGKKLLDNSEYINPVSSNALAADKPEFGIANEDVPEHLKEWICTPQKFQNYMEAHKPEDAGDSESNSSDGSPGPFGVAPGTN